jgi:hypothetical protein
MQKSAFIYEMTEQFRADVFADGGPQIIATFYGSNARHMAIDFCERMSAASSERVTQFSAGQFDFVDGRKVRQRVDICRDAAASWNGVKL